MDRIPGAAELYIGDHSSSLDQKTLQQSHVTHILSALKPPLDPGAYLPFKHLIIGVDDLDEEDVIQHFSLSNAFIQEGLDGGGGVLVHCANGRSRSTTFLIAYLLSRNPTLNPNDALTLIRQGRPSAEPNSGFMSQLNLYHTMGCPSTPANHPIYQRWLYQRNLEANLSTGLAPSTIHFSDDNNNNNPSSPHSTNKMSDSPLTTGSKPPFPSSSSTQSTIRCRRCRTPLATSMYLVPHDPPPSISTSTSTSRDISSTSPCAHLFLQPLSWMRSELEQGKLEGRLECPKRTCRANVGKYAWQGMRCSCGVWVVPGISVAKGRVDEIGGVGGGGGVEGRGGIRLRMGAGMRTT